MNCRISKKSQEIYWYGSLFKPYRTCFESFLPHGGFRTRLKMWIFFGWNQKRHTGKRNRNADLLLGFQFRFHFCGFPLFVSQDIKEFFIAQRTNIINLSLVARLFHDVFLKHYSCLEFSEDYRNLSPNIVFDILNNESDYFLISIMSFNQFQEKKWTRNLANGFKAK